MVRKTLPALFTLFAVLSATALRAEAPQTSVVVVAGVSEGDLLNLRAAASPTGKIETRLPNGTSLKAFGCDNIGGYDWCEVQDIDNPRMRGWVPARYLREADPAEIASASATLATGATEPSSTGLTGSPDAPARKEAGKIELPSDLSARFGGAQPAPGGKAEEKSVAAVRKAMLDAYTLPGRAADHGAGKADSLDGAAENGETAAPKEADSGEAPAAGIPVPTPRPGRNEETSATETTVAQVQQPAASTAAQTLAPDASGEIPCARYIGQPMTHCTASVVRKGDGVADVTVTWPDGGNRVINFRDGKPAGSNSRAEFRFTREGALNMIRIGQSERFEITDALAFED